MEIVHIAPVYLSIDAVNAAELHGRHPSSVRKDATGYGKGST